MKYKQDNSTLRKKQTMLQRAIEDIAEEHKSLELRDKELMEQSQLLQKEVQAHKKEIKTRDATIFEKEKRISELKKKNQELDKFKFVLDFKIRELKQQIEPRQKEIMDKRQQIKKLDEELEKFHKSNAQLDHLIGDIRGKIDDMQVRVKDTRSTAKQLENNMNTCRSEVQSAMVYIQQPPALIAHVQKIVVKYGSTELIKPRIDSEVEGEYNRHRSYLQHSIQELKKNLEHVSLQHRGANTVIREQNMALIGQINSQRDENKALKGIVQAEIGRIRHLLNNLNNNGNTGAANNNTGKRGYGYKGSQDGSANNAAPGSANNTLMNLPGMNILADANNNTNMNGTNNDFGDPSDILLRNQRRLQALQQLLDDLQARGQTLLTQTLPRTLSTEGLGGSRPGTGSHMNDSNSASFLPTIGNNNNNSNASGSRRGSNNNGNVVSLPPLVSTQQPFTNNNSSNNGGIAAIDFTDSVTGTHTADQRPEDDDLGYHHPGNYGNRNNNGYGYEGGMMPQQDTDGGGDDFAPGELAFPGLIGVSTGEEGTLRLTEE